jgi:PHD/YefM family antitoxin component YafN of YafNO toxin-antitoxin module
MLPPGHAESCYILLYWIDMALISTKDIVPISQARIRLTELADDVSKSGHEKVFTKNGESYVALITAEQLDDYRRFKEAEHLSMLRALVEAAEDIDAGHVYTWDEFKPRLAKLRAKAKRIAGK